MSKNWWLPACRVLASMLVVPGGKNVGSVMCRRRVSWWNCSAVCTWICPFGGGVGQANSAGLPYRNIHDDCDFFGGPSDSVLVCVLGGGVTFDDSQCAGSAAGRCISCQFGAVRYPTFGRACMSVCLSVGVVLFPALCVSVMRSSVVCCWLPALSGPGSLFLPMPVWFGALVFTHGNCLSHRVLVFSVDFRPPVCVGCLVVNHGVVVGLSASPSNLLIWSSGKTTSRRLLIDGDVRLVWCFGRVGRSHFGSIGCRFAANQVGNLIGFCRGGIVSCSRVGRSNLLPGPPFACRTDVGDMCWPIVSVSSVGSRVAFKALLVPNPVSLVSVEGLDSETSLFIMNVSP